jgi:hypothetical protein
MGVGWFAGATRIECAQRSGIVTADRSVRRRAGRGATPYGIVEILHGYPGVSLRSTPGY